jgi:hypothetical protein
VDVGGGSSECGLCHRWMNGDYGRAAEAYVRLTLSLGPFRTATHGARLATTGSKDRDE